MKKQQQKIKPVKLKVQYVKAKPVTIRLIKSPTIKISRGSGKNGRRMV